MVSTCFQVGIPTAEEKGLAFIICPFVFIILSVALTAFYYHQFHPGGTFKTNGPKRCSPQDNETDALYECNTLFCCNVWHCKFISCCHVCNCKYLGYLKMKRSKSSGEIYAPNGHIEISMETYSNMNGDNDEIRTTPSFNNQNGHRMNTNSVTV